MSNLIWKNKDDFLHFAYNNMQNVDVLLDIGTGIVPHDYINARIYICCEPYEEYLNVLNKKIENEEMSIDSFFLLQQYNWEDVTKNFKEKSVDTIFLIDVIEHLEKEEGRQLLAKTIKIARRQIVIFTPMAYIEQKTKNNKDAWGLNGKRWQEHKSVWTPDDFDDSWKCICCKEYHDTNNIGEKLDKPVGAFWAIKTICDENEKDEFYYPDKNSLVKSLDIMKEKYNKTKSNLIKAEEKYIITKEKYNKKNVILTEIYNSKGWKFLTLWRKIKSKLM